ncbi:ankyrin repeat-containing domain protein [Trichoderma pleuroticola]
MGEMRYIKCVSGSEETRAQDQCNDQSHQTADQIEGAKTGMQLEEDIVQERKKHQAELLVLKEQMREEMARQNAELQRVFKEECDKLKESIRFNEEEKNQLKQGSKDVHARNECEFIELQKKLEVLEQQTKGYADREHSQAQEYEERIRNMEDVNRIQQEALERQAKERSKREKHEAWLQARRNKNNNGTSLHEAAVNGRVNVIRSLLDRGANIEAENRDGNSPLFMAAWHGKVAVAEMLLNRGAYVQPVNNYGNTPLHDAAQTGQVAMAVLLLDRGADMEAKNHDGNSPLFMAAWHGKVAVAKMLLDRGANIQLANEYGNTSLHDAAQTGQVAMAKLLLDRGANIEARSKSKETPLGCALRNGKQDVIKLLRDRGARR